MKLSENIDKVIWVFLDKGLFILYGFVALLQMRRLEPEILGLYAILISIHTWTFIISDSLFLNSIIQFGFVPEKERRANSFSLIFTVAFTLLASSIFYFPSNFWALIFKEPNFYKIASALPLLTLATIPRIYSIKFCFKHSSMFKLFLIDSIFFGSLTISTIFFFFRLRTFTFELIFGIYLFGTILSSIFAILLIRKYIKLGFAGNLGIKEFFQFGFPMFSLSFFQSIPKQLDILILQFFFQAKFVGVYYSAKTLFRLFEELMNASAGLVYPTAVRLISKNKRFELNSLLSKSISFTFITVLLSFLILEFGGSSLILNFILPKNYQNAIPLFNLMLFATLFMPFQLFASVLIAEGYPFIVSKYIFISTFFSISIFVLIGLGDLFNFAPLGIIFYYFTLFMLLFKFSGKRYHFEPMNLFSGFTDIINYLKSIKN